MIIEIIKILEEVAGANSHIDYTQFEELAERIGELHNSVPPVINCDTCKHQELSKYTEPCRGCNDYSNHQIKGVIVL